MKLTMWLAVVVLLKYVHEVSGKTVPVAQRQTLRNLGLPSLQGDLLYSSPGAPSSVPFRAAILVG